jgi:4-hydroxy-tetrahydrodipicolinate reductase
MASPSSITVMVNGLAGAMGNEISRACLRRGFALAPLSMTGRSNATLDECEIQEGDKIVKVKLVGPGDGHKKVVADMQAKYGKGLIIIDFTHPTAVIPNADIYAELKCPFVMGTTGGDRQKLMKVTTDSDTYAVIAPNMSKQIVAFQATFEHMASTYPNAFGGYKFELTESHQAMKADTSGTAKDMVSSFNSLGVQPFMVEDIKKVRDPQEQSKLGVPKEHIDGHAWHTYTLSSADGSVEFEFKHNVCGRRTYAEGVADAVQFLAGKIVAGSEKRVFSMIDVLSEGNMK